MAVKWEYKVGPLTINFRALLEPKGFLRILTVVRKLCLAAAAAIYTHHTFGCSIEYSTTCEQTVLNNLSLPSFLPPLPDHFNLSLLHHCWIHRRP